MPPSGGEYRSDTGKESHTACRNGSSGYHQTGAVSSILGARNAGYVEQVRTELRELVKLLEGGKKQKFIIDIEDTYESVESGEDVIIQTSYKQRVTDYLARNIQNATLQKIQTWSLRLPILPSWNAFSLKSWVRAKSMMNWLKVSLTGITSLPLSE